MPLALDSTLIRLWSAVLQLGQGLARVDLARTAADHGPGWERHTVATLMVCLNGVVRLELPDGRHDLNAGQACLVAPGVPHRHAPLRPGCAAIGIGFMLGRADLELTTDSESWILTIEEQPVRRLLECACRSGAADREAAVRTALAQLSVQRATPLEPMPEAVRRMWVYLRARRLDPITVADVLRASGLGTSRARQCFRTWFGAAPQAVLQQYRLEYAAFLLAGGWGPGAVAAACGFRTRRQLTAAHRRVHGVPPRRSRQESTDRQIRSRGTGGR